MLRLEKLAPANFAFSTATPFGIFEIADVLSPADYAALDREFPQAEVFHQTWDNGGKRYFDNTTPEFFDFLKDAPAWWALYHQLADPRLGEKLYALAHHFPSSRPRHEQNPWELVIPLDRLNPTWAEARRSPAIRWKSLRTRLAGRTAARIKFEFSSLGDGGFLAPHTDVPPKLVSLMLYFPDPDVPPEAGTVFYEGRSESLSRARWNVGMLEADMATDFLQGHEVFHRAPFIANRLTGFVKTGVSWHGLERLHLPPGVRRRSVNINFFCV